VKTFSLHAKKGKHFLPAIFLSPLLDLYISRKVDRHIVLRPFHESLFFVGSPSHPERHFVKLYLVSDRSSPLSLLLSFESKANYLSSSSEKDNSSSPSREISPSLFAIPPNCPLFFFFVFSDAPIYSPQHDFFFGKRDGPASAPPLDCFCFFFCLVLGVYPHAPISPFFLFRRSSPTSITRPPFPFRFLIVIRTF